MVDMVRWKTGVSNTEYLVHLVRMNRLCACTEFCGVHSWQLEWHEMYRNGVKVLWCHSHLVWLVFRVSSYMRLFSFIKLFCDLFCYFFFAFCIVV